jgi:hypothetical protein
VERLVAAREGQPAAAPRLVPMTALPLASNLPPPADPVFVSLTAAERARVIGEYEMEGGAVARVFEHDGRLFMSIPGQGEAELFATDPLTFTVKVEAGVTIAFETGGDGRVTGVDVTIGQQTIAARRR